MSLLISDVIEYERVWVESLNRGDVSGADRAFASDCIIHVTGEAEPVRGREAWKQFVGGLLVAFPDLHFTMEDQFSAGDRVALRWRATATHTGPLGNIPATGKRMEIDGLIIDRLANGIVVERWEQWDQPRMLQQLGLV
jgi:steroid delta-isomerase-like uncharacterized protein